MQNREDKREFIRAFSGGHHYIIDYLVGEVLSSQTEDIQNFLLQTSILDRFSASLCDTILGISDSNEHIQYLNSHNVFLIPLDDERNWYRYHHLFSDFLNQRLHEREPENESKLHRRASDWLEQNGYYSEAINHSLAGEDYEHAAKLIEGIGPDMMMQSEFDQLTRWLDDLPGDVVENWPWLCIIRAWMYDRWAQFDQGERYLQHAETTLNGSASNYSGEAENMIRGQISAIRALYTLKKGKILDSIEYSNQALEYLPEETFNRGVASFSLGWAKIYLGDLPGAILAYEEARRASIAAGNRILAQAIVLEIGKTQFYQGHLHQAAETFRQAIQFKYEKSQIKIPYAGPASISLANILREWDDLDAAMIHLQEGIEIGIASKVVDAIALGYSSLALVHLAQGDMEAAIQACEKADRMVMDIPDLESETISRTLDSRVRLLLSQNEFSEASRYLQEKGVSVDDQIEHFIEYKHFALIRTLIYSGHENIATENLSSSHTLIDKIIQVAKSAGYGGKLIEALALQAMTYDAQGNHDQAISSLEEAISLAEPERYIRTFIDEGKPMQTLLRQVKSRGNLASYVKVLLDAFEPSEIEIQKFPSQKLIEPLSKRELEVLRMLTTELSGPEIARELMISPNTLRTHTKNIYAKLGVSNRRSAIRQAREDKLI
jgi:LuxR family maltose regulon positive regulatory protein